MHQKIREQQISKEKAGILSTEQHPEKQPGSANYVNAALFLCNTGLTCFCCIRLQSCIRWSVSTETSAFYSPANSSCYIHQGEEISSDPFQKHLAKKG